MGAFYSSLEFTLTESWCINEGDCTGSYETFGYVFQDWI